MMPATMVDFYPFTCYTDDRNSLKLQKLHHSNCERKPFIYLFSMFCLHVPHMHCNCRQTDAIGSNSYGNNNVEFEIHFNCSIRSEICCNCRRIPMTTRSLKRVKMNPFYSPNALNLILYFFQIFGNTDTGIDTAN